MREILFRAKRIDNSEWIEGLLTVMWGQYHIINPKEENTAYPIDTDTICQYTGLTDKNGKKLWENDIVNCHEKRGAAFFRCVVLWNDVKARFDVKTTNCYFPMTLDGIAGDSAINGLDYETIGNIFDNTELLLTEIY